MHYSNVQTGSEKLGIVNIFKKGSDNYLIVLSKSKYGSNDKREFPAINFDAQNTKFHPLFVAYKCGQDNSGLGSPIVFCDLPQRSQTFISERLLKECGNDACL